MNSPSLDKPEMQAWRAFLRSHARLMAALDDELMAAHNLPLADYDVLVQLSEGPALGIRMSDLANRTMISRSGLTRRVDRLEATGLVERRVCPSDRRGFVASLTKAGRARLREAAPTHVDGVRRMFADALNPEQLAALSCGLGEVVLRSGGDPEGD